MEEFEIIGKLDLNKLGKYKSIVAQEKVILTNERKQHIFERHSKHYELFEKYLPEILYNPDYILEDYQNENTIILLKEIYENNNRIKIIIKLSTNNERYNSIITFWNIRKRNYDKTIDKGKIIFQKLDKKE